MQSQDNNNDLKEIRKDQGLSLEQVARKIKLSVDVIRKIENSEFETLGAFTYIRGYLMHYTRLLGVEAEKYIQLVPKDELNVPLVNTGSTLNKSIKFKSKSVNFASYAIGTIVVFAVSFTGWYMLKNYSNTINSNRVATVDELQITPQQGVQTEELSAVNNKDTESSFHYSSLIPTNPPDSKVENNSDEMTLLIPEVPLETTNEDLKSEANKLVEDEEIKPLYSIIIEANETSWVKVELKDGTKLHNDLLNPGSISLEANEQVHFRIGNEKQVKVTVNGEQLDISAYARKDIADFNWPTES